MFATKPAGRRGIRTISNRRWRVITEHSGDVTLHPVLAEVES